MGFFQNIKSYLTNETDTRCPKCGESNLYLVDNPTGLFKDGYCPKCHYILHRNSKFGSGDSPEPPTPPTPLSLF